MKTRFEIGTVIDDELMAMLRAIAIGEFIVIEDCVWVSTLAGVVILTMYDGVMIIDDIIAEDEYRLYEEDDGTYSVMCLPA